MRFWKNWNGKLDQSIFNTIRGEDKEILKSKVGQEFDVYIKDVFKCKAILISVDVQEMRTIPAGFLMTDTGLDDMGAVMDLFLRLDISDPFDKVSILTFKRVEDKVAFDRTAEL
jgi:hypothetical protein